MIIAPQQVVTLHYTLRDADDNVLDDSRQRGEPLSYLHGHDNIVAGLERALAGSQAGAKLSVTLLPAEAYGLRDEALVQQVVRSAFSGVGSLAAGMRFQAQGPDGARAVTILEVHEEQVVIDANHPLAGQTLSYAIEILSVRPATRAELAKGHPLDEDTDPRQVEDRPKI